ncbi:helix-turn-helix domain-containing protein [Shimia sp. FJ5]|uniref:helix-turn-helix domain-containing protein n=1 Tax=Shimia sp. FJ5 TaxID=3079054 RepID=UPI0026297DD1|nr:helix-turn-helix transcriptional regulator [Shimia sp. FJ5]MDV4146770.1 helix-turn-helix transcriptional regulator [Shimia sp. FJ5]
MKLRDRVALNIQDLRRARGLSQEELALRAGVNRGYMGKLENAKYAASLDILEKIAAALSVDPSALVAPRR